MDTQSVAVLGLAALIIGLLLFGTKRIGGVFNYIAVLLVIAGGAIIALNSLSGWMTVVAFAITFLVAGAMLAKLGGLPNFVIGAAGIIIGLMAIWQIQPPEVQDAAMQSLNELGSALRAAGAFASSVVSK